MLPKSTIGLARTKLFSRKRRSASSRFDSARSSPGMRDVARDLRMAQRRCADLNGSFRTCFQTLHRERGSTVQPCMLLWIVRRAYATVAVVLSNIFFAHVRERSDEQ